MSDKLIKLKTVLEYFEVSKSHWYALIIKGDAPKPIKVGRSSFWSLKEINKYLELLKKENNCKKEVNNV